MARYMLDTNTVSHLIREHPAVVRRVVAVPMASLCISAITEGELHFGLAKRPGARRLNLGVLEFLRRVDIFGWDTRVAEQYGAVRAELESRGKTLGALDMLIAAHALSVDAVLVTNDKAFGAVPNLRIEDWSLS
jgi:tRNA(fMet)-specific endonuclease VapC